LPLDYPFLSGCDEPLSKLLKDDSFTMDDDDRPEYRLSTVWKKYVTENNVFSIAGAQ